MSQAPVVVPAETFKDRRAGLIIFGILVVLIGCVCALFVPMILVGQAIAAQDAGGQPDYRTVIPGAITYGLLAVAFIWLGIGSTLCRRWARALLLILSWAWLVVGVFTVAFMVIFMPEILAMPPPSGQKVSEAMKWTIVSIMMGVLGVIFILLPGALVLFYRGRNVKATCEARDPVARWTDACPLPALALSLLMGFGALSMISMFLSYKTVLPFFGMLITGAPATVFFAALMVLWAWAARACYRLQPAGWWVVLITWGMFLLSTVITFVRIEPVEMYRQMGYPEQQLAQMQQFSFVRGRNMVTLGLVFAVPFFGYLAYLKRFFRPRN